MICPSEKCASSNVQHLPHYWRSLPNESPLKAEYAEPAEGDAMARLVLVLIAIAGVVLAVTGTVGLGLIALAVGTIGGWVVHGRIVLAAQERDRWGRSRICLACTHLWVP